MSLEDELMPENEFHPQLASPRVKRTSKVVFQSIIDEGLLSRQRRRVYELLYTDGPLTGREVNEKLETVSGHKRLSELQRLDVVDVYGKKRCRITGRDAEAWDVTGRMPLSKQKATPMTLKAKLLKSVSRAERLAKALRLRPRVRRKESAEEFLGRYLSWEKKYAAPINDDIEEESNAE